MRQQHPSPPQDARFEPLIVAGQAEATATSVTIPFAESTQVLARPQSIAALWVEDEYNELEEEQHHLWEASSIAASEPMAATAAQSQLAAVELTGIVHTHQTVVEDAQERLVRTATVLAPFRRRAKGTKLWYQAAKCGLLIGDVAGFATAAMWLGELPFIAMTLATSAAVATIAAGLIGVDVRDREQRRQRAAAVPEPSDAQREFPHLFTQDMGGGVLKRMLLVALLTAGTIGVGIAALRSVVDDPLVGLIFGGIALAVAGGSFLVSYAGADEVADLLEHAQADYTRVVAEHIQLSSHAQVRDFAAAETSAESIAAEHTVRGRAAAARVRSFKWGILRRNPSHAGHGPAATAIGQTPRRSGGEA